MQVEIGNPCAIEGVFLEDGSLEYRPYPGEWVTTLVIPDEVPIPEAAATVLASLERHMDIGIGAIPSWIESDRPELALMLNQHFGLRDRTRPARWGDGTNGPYPTKADPNPNTKKKES